MLIISLTVESATMPGPTPKPAQLRVVPSKAAGLAADMQNASSARRSLLAGLGPMPRGYPQRRTARDLGAAGAGRPAGPVPHAPTAI